MTKTNRNRKFTTRRIIAVVAGGSVALSAYALGISTSPGVRGEGVSSSPGRSVATRSNVVRNQDASNQQQITKIQAARKAGKEQQEYLIV